MTRGCVTGGVCVTGGSVTRVRGCGQGLCDQGSVHTHWT